MKIETAQKTGDQIGETNEALHRAIVAVFQASGGHLPLQTQCAILTAAASNIIKLGGADPVEHLAVMLTVVAESPAAARTALEIAIMKQSAANARSNG